MSLDSKASSTISITSLHMSMLSGWGIFPHDRLAVEIRSKMRRILESLESLRTSEGIAESLGIINDCISSKASMMRVTAIYDQHTKFIRLIVQKTDL